jgi:hypothetical protein
MELWRRLQIGHLFSDLRSENRYAYGNVVALSCEIIFGLIK